ncbi:MAG: M28 family peptidase [Bacteroidota bacterium]
MLLRKLFANISRVVDLFTTILFLPISMSAICTRSLLLIVLMVHSGIAQQGNEKTLSTRVSQKRLLSTVRELVAIGPRMGGTPSGDKSVRYLVQRLKTLGLSVEVVEEPAKLTFINHSWSLRVDQPRGLRNLIKREWLGGFSPSVPPSRSQLELWPLPEAVPDDSIRGKAFLLETPISSKAYLRLVEHGATCLLLGSPYLDGAYSDWAYITDLSPSERNAIPLFNLSFNNALILKNTLEEGIPVVMSFSSQVTIAPGAPRTIVATLKGASDKYYIVCAHGDSDSGGPGADDNASGVAGVLELAHVLNGMVRSGHLPKPAFTIKFIIWGSEIYSTEHYVRTHQETLENILGVLNYDEIGTGVSRNCIYFESNDVEHNEKLLRTLEGVGEEFVGKKGFWDEATTNPSQGGTDSYVFLPHWLARLDLPKVEIPSVTVFTGAWNELKTLPQTEGWSSKAWQGHPDSVVVDFSAYYHSSLDTPSRTTEKEPFNMVWAVKAVGIALLRLAW